jgi:predicted HD phosphohydrolase
MEDGTSEEYAFLAKHEAAFAHDLPDRIMTRLEGLRNSLSGYKVDRLEHSLQCATRAERDGADVDWIVCALVHDLGDDLAPYNHDSLAAAIVKPYVREECSWTVQHHGIFQYKYYADKVGLNPEERQKYKDSPYFEAAEKFCRDWDQNSFDPDYDSFPLAHFKPALEEVFRRPAWDTKFTGAPNPNA